MEKLKTLLNKSEFIISKFIVPVISASIAVSLFNLMYINI